jgi:hypothetical protein
MVEHIALGRDGIVGGLSVIGETRTTSTALTVISGFRSLAPDGDFLKRWRLSRAFGRPVWLAWRK